MLPSASMMRPAFEQSSTNKHGAPSQVWRSKADTGMYCVKDRLKTQSSPFVDGRGTPWPLKWRRSRSSRPPCVRRKLRQTLRSSSSVGSAQSR